MPEQPTNPLHAPQIVAGVRRWFLIRHRWFRHLKRWQRWVIRVSIGAPLALLALLLLLTRSPLTRSLVLPRLERASNLAIEADSVYVRANGRLVLNNARFRIPSVPGPAGLLLQVDRITADVDWEDVLLGNARVREVELLRPVVRVSQSINPDRSVNLAGISAPDGMGGGAGSGGMRLPRIVARDGAIELGEHTPARYTMLKRLPVEGLLTPAPRGEAGYIVGLTEFRRDRAGMKPGFQIHGRIHDDAFAIEMDDFSLDDWPPETVPRPVRDLFADLGLRGRVPSATFRFSEAMGVSAELTLDGVELNLPIEPSQPLPGGDRFMRMHAVHGSVTFRQDSVLVRAEGMLEDLPYRVVLLYEGTSPDAPFTCEIVSEGFQIEKAPRLLPYAPPLVAKRLATFSGPTATLDTRLLVRRGTPTEDGPGPITFRGWMNVSNGRAAFDKFPYPFEDLSARVYFDNERVEVRDVRGVSPTGATLTAHADIAPANDDAQIDVWVNVVGAPIDEALEAAFGPGRDRVMHALFNKGKHRALVDAGLVISPEEATRTRDLLRQARADLEAAGGDRVEALQARIAELQAQLERPVFDFGGVADVSVRVHRPPGDDVEWTSDVDVRIARAGLVPDAFPLPINARDVVCSIRDGDAVVSGGVYEGLVGGTGHVSATFVLPPSKDPGADPRADVTINVADMPLDARAIFALPGADGSTLKRMLRGLKIDGRASGRVHVAPLDVLGRAAEGESNSGFDAELLITGVTSSPADPAAGAVGPLLTDATGSIRVTERTASVTVEGVAGAPASPAPVRVQTDARFEIRRNPDAPSPPPRIHTVVTTTGADLRLPVERAVRVFSEKAADDIIKLRQKHNPDGVTDVVATIDVADGKTSSVLLDVTASAPIAFDWFGGRVGLTPTEGAVRVQCIGGVEAEFRSMAGPMAFDGQPVADVRLNGRYRFSPPPGESPPPDDSRVLHVSGKTGRIESPFVSAVLAGPVGRDRLTAFEAIQPRGLFDAELDIRGGGGEPLRVTGTMEPTSFACVLDGTPVAFDRCSGWISFEGKAGTFQHLSGLAPTWSITLDGGWKPSAGGVLLDMAMQAQGESFTPDARSFLPAALRKALDDIKLGVSGPFSLSDARLTTLAGVERSAAWTRFDGTIGFQDLSFEAGAVISGCQGRAAAHYEQAVGGAPTYRIGAVLDRLSVGAAEAYNARALIQSGSSQGELVVPLISGECHGGRFSGRVRVAPVGDREREYAASFQLSGVDFGLLLHDLGTPPAGVVPVGAPPQEVKPAPAPGARGWLDAELSLAGFIAVPETRRGRGALRVSGNDVRIMNFPGIVRLVEVSNLALPANEALDYAEADFYIDGGVVSFDRLSVFSRAIEIAGFGTMTWPAMQLDLRFNSRSARPIPMVSWLVQGIRHQLVATSVQGTAKKPEVRLISMPGTRRMLGRVIGSEETERSRRLLELERRSSLSRHGIRPTGTAIPGSVTAEHAQPRDGP